MTKLDGGVPLCWVCAHLRISVRGRLTCDAFPLSIPRAIQEGRYDHRQPFPGDDGIRFLMASDAPRALQDSLKVPMA